METDDKIKPGIRCCQTQYNKNCVDCPYQKYKSSAISTVTCSSELRKDILDLVNRQEARFNFLKNANELQKKYRKIEIMSKKALCELCIPFRDKYLLSDLVVLRIARDEISLTELIELAEREDFFR